MRFDNTRFIYSTLFLVSTLLSACLGGNNNSPTVASSTSISATANTTAQSLTVGTAMTSFSPLTPSGGTTPYSYSYSGTLPAGLSFSTSTGAVTGTPTATFASANVVFSVQDANAVVANTTSTVSFSVGAASATIHATATTTAQSLTVGTAMASFSPLSPSGGTAPYTYSITSGTLPSGLSLNASTGAVTGTPSAIYSAANVVFSVKDANNVVASTTSTVSFAVAWPTGYVSEGGLTWTPTSTTTYNYTQATALCAGTISGQTDWHLPTLIELNAFYAAYPNSSPVLSNLGWTLSSAWTTTLYSMPYSAHSKVSLASGIVGWGADVEFDYVTCVR